jgi:hypothetical protein
MSMFSRTLLVLTVLLAGMTADAQRIYPGSKYVNNVIFTSFSVNYKLSMIVAGKTQPSFAQMKDELRTTTLNGRKVVIRVQSYSDGSQIDTSIADAKTYEPIYYSGVKAKKPVQLTFAANSVKGKDSSATVNVSLSKPVFYSGFYDLLVRGALIHTGYQETMPVYLNDVRVNRVLLSTSCAMRNSRANQTHGSLRQKSTVRKRLCGLRRSIEVS